MTPEQVIRIAVLAAVFLGTVVPAAAQTPLDAPDISRIAEQQETTTVRLVVPPLPGATGYRFRVGVDREFGKLVTDTVQRRSEIRILDLRDGEYYYGVRGVDASGNQGKEALGRFRLQRPPPPALTDPQAPAPVPAAPEPSAPPSSPASTQ